MTQDSSATHKARSLIFYRQRYQLSKAAGHQTLRVHPLQESYVLPAVGGKSCVVDTVEKISTNCTISPHTNDYTLERNRLAVRSVGNPLLINLM